LDSQLNQQINIHFDYSLQDPFLTKYSCIIDIPVSLKDVQNQSEDISKPNNNEIKEKSEKMDDIKLYKYIKNELQPLGIDINEHIFTEHEKITKLDLIGLNLKAVPEFIKALKDLEHLNLQNNLIEELPQFLDEMPNLKSIDVSKNPLNLTPQRIDELNQKFLFYW
jgi:Leucine-rich repeat (LRR) protein